MLRDKTDREWSKMGRWLKFERLLVGAYPRDALDLLAGLGPFLGSYAIQMLLHVG